MTIAAVGVGRSYGRVNDSSIHAKVDVWVCVAVIVIAGVFAVRYLSNALGRGLARQSNIGAGAILRLVATGIGSVSLVFAIFGVLGVSLAHLLIGVGLAGVVLGIAAQQSLGNIFAATVLAIARPFVVGDDIQIRSGAVGIFDAQVRGIGLTYVTVETADGLLKIPNSVMLASGIGQPKPQKP